MLSLEAMGAATAATDGECSPIMLYTHGRPIHVGCGRTCGSSRLKVTTSQSQQECTNISEEIAGKMQPFLGYMCPVGWCDAQQTCQLSGLKLECWNANTKTAATRASTSNGR
uniref:Evasin n=1 Tax=Rhipicephalus zambeziensis TaxID=60191 RepID=A0A224Y3C0_9ACAR